MRILAVTLLLSVMPFSCPAQQKPACSIYFTVVWHDELNNLKQGLDAKDATKIQKKFSQKYPEICYAPPADAVKIVFFIDSSKKETYHGTQTRTSTRSMERSAEHPSRCFITRFSGREITVGSEKSRDPGRRTIREGSGCKRRKFISRAGTTSLREIDHHPAGKGSRSICCPSFG